MKTKLMVAVIIVAILLSLVPVSYVTASGNLFETIKDDVPVWSEPSSGSEQIRKLDKGTLVTIVEIVTNKAGNPWGKTLNGTWIYMGNLVKSSQALPMTGEYITINDNVPLRYIAAAGGTIQKYLSKDSIVTISSTFYNDRGNPWGSTKDGYVIYMGNIKKYTRPSSGSELVTAGLFETIKDDVPVWREPSSGSEQIRKLSKGTLVTIVEVITNKAGNPWGKTVNGTWVYMGNLVKSSKSLPMTGEYITVNDNVPLRYTAAAGGTIVKYLPKDTIVTISSTYFNDRGNPWGSTIDGYVIFMGNVREYSKPATGSSSGSESVPGGTSIIEGKEYYIISTLGSGDKALEIFSGNKGNGAVLHLYTHVSNRGNQIFTFHKVQGDEWRIISKHSGKAVEVRSSNMSPGGIVQQWEFKNIPTMKWHIISLGNGTYSFSNVNSGLYMDVTKGIAASGTAIQQWKPNGTAAQQFKLVPVNIKENNLSNLETAKNHLESLEEAKKLRNKEIYDYVTKSTRYNTFDNQYVFSRLSSVATEYHWEIAVEFVDILNGTYSIPGWINTFRGKEREYAHRDGFSLIMYRLNDMESLAAYSEGSLRSYIKVLETGGDITSLTGELGTEIGKIISPLRYLDYTLEELLFYVSTVDTHLQYFDALERACEESNYPDNSVCNAIRGTKKEFTDRFRGRNFLDFTTDAVAYTLVPGKIFIDIPINIINLGTKYDKKTQFRQAYEAAREIDQLYNAYYRKICVWYKFSDEERQEMFDTFSMLHDLRKASVITVYELMLSINPSGYSRSEIEKLISEVKNLPTFGIYP